MKEHDHRDILLEEDEGSTKKEIPSKVFITKPANRYSESTFG